MVGQAPLGAEWDRAVDDWRFLCAKERPKKFARYMTFLRDVEERDRQISRRKAQQHRNEIHAEGQTDPEDGRVVIFEDPEIDIE